MTMSAMYVVLLFAAYFFHGLHGTTLDRHGIFNIPFKLQKLVASLYYWPDISLDNAEDLEVIFDRNNEGYIDLVTKAACDYTNAIAAHMRQYGDKSIIRDRPNSHRLTELVVHSLLLFGHGKNFYQNWYSS